ncbi:MAG: hypothetical protein KBG19_00425 [Bacteroidales bacterium]|jgi:hypothetical protein|nr:hypothetical protein [Bacteroidales bacterium]
MELIVYDRRNSGYSRGKHFVRFNRNSGLITFSKSLCETINITEGSKISFCQDKKRPSDWFLTFDESNGFEALSSKNHNGLVIFSKKIASRVLDTIDVVKSCSFNVATEITQHGGNDYYAIITSNPINVR